MLEYYLNCHYKIEHLGHTIYQGGLVNGMSKEEAIRQIPQPIDVSQIRTFTGLANYY
jgi:hypothetical protein